MTSFMKYVRFWSTSVNLAETRELFCDFLKGLNFKHYAMHDRELGILTHV